MKYYDILKFNGELLHRLHDAGARSEDYKYIPLYEDYCSMVRSGEKVSYAVFVLAERYNVSERFVYYTISRFEKEVTASGVQ